MSFKLTEIQKQTLANIRENNRSQSPLGMSKWEVKFLDESHSTMLSDIARDRESAYLGAIERFGSKVIDVY